MRLSVVPLALFFAACSGPSGLVPNTPVPPNEADTDADADADTDTDTDADSDADTDTDTDADSDADADTDADADSDTDTDADADSDTDADTDADADTDTDADTDADADTDTDPLPFSLALTVDGDRSDWSAPILFANSGGVGEAAITWDSQALFVGVDHPDIQSGTGEHWVHIYIGNSTPGSTTGLLFNTQAPALPFQANHVIAWKMDDSYAALFSWNGSDWAPDDTWFTGATGAVVAESNVNQVVEFRLPRGVLGVGTSVEFAMSMVFEGAANESTYAAVPADTLNDGYDPDFSTRFVFDLASPADPNSTVAQ